MATKIQVDVDKQKPVDALKEIKKGVEDVGDAAVKTAQDVANVKPPKVEVAVNKQAVADLKEIEKGVEAVGHAAQKASAQVAQVKPPATGDAGGVSDAMKQADELIAKLDEAEAAATATTAAAGAGWGKLGAAIATVVGAVAAAKAAYEAFQAIVKTAAENGDADSQRLVAAFNGIGSSWEDVQKRLAEAPGMASAMGWLERMAKTAGELTRSVGHLATGFAGNTMGLSAEETDKAVQKQLDLNQSRMQMVEVTKMLAEFEHRERVDALREEHKKLETLEEVNAAIEAEKKALKEKTEEQLADGKAIALSEEKLISLEQRKKRVINENEQAAKDAAKEAERATEKAAKELEKEAEIHEKFQQKELEKRVQRIMDELQAELKAEADAKAARLKMEAEYLKARDQLLKGIGKDPGIQAAAQQVNQQAADPRAIARRLSDNAGEAAYMAASGGGQFELTPRDRKYIEDQKRQAYRDAIRQSQGQKTSGMPFTPEQIQGAIQQNAQAVLKNVGETKDVSAENLDATGMLVQEYQKNSAELQQMNAEVQLMKQAINGTAQQNAKRRAQAGSNRP